MRASPVHVNDMQPASGPGHRKNCQESQSSDPQHRGSFLAGRRLFTGRVKGTTTLIRPERSPGPFRERGRPRCRTKKNENDDREKESVRPHRSQVLFIHVGAANNNKKRECSGVAFHGCDSKGSEHVPVIAEAVQWDVWQSQSHSPQFLFR